MKSCPRSRRASSSFVLGLRRFDAGAIASLQRAIQRVRPTTTTTNAARGVRRAVRRRTQRGEYDDDDERCDFLDDAAHRDLNDSEEYDELFADGDSDDDLW